jgi:Ca2+/Na+ antiporter
MTKRNMIKRQKSTLVEQELLILLEHMSSPRFLVGFVLLDLQFYVYVLLIVVYPFVLFLMAIMLSVLRYTDSDCSFGIFKHFLTKLHR